MTRGLILSGISCWLLPNRLPNRSIHNFFLRRRGFHDMATSRSHLVLLLVYLYQSDKVLRLR